MANKPRILYILRQYPLVCETYIQSEIDALRDDYEIRVVSFLAVKDAAEYSADPAPYKLVSGPDEILQEILSFRPPNWSSISTRWATRPPKSRI